MTTKQTIASSLSYMYDKLFPKTLLGLCHSPKANLSVALNSLTNKDDSSI